MVLNSSMSFVAVSESDVNAWFQASPGSLLLAHQQALVDSLITQRVSSNKRQFVLEAGLSADLALWNAKGAEGTKSTKQTLSLFDLIKGRAARTGSLHSLLASLKPRSMQLTLVHHLLEFCGDQYDRMLCDLLEVTEYGGTLLVIGLNPLGIWPNWVRCTKQVFWHRAQLVSVYSLAKHLAALGCIQIQYTYHLPFFPYGVSSRLDSGAPTYVQSKLQKLYFPGCYYSLSAVVSTPNWIRRADLASVISYISKPALGLKPATKVSKNRV